MADTSDDEFGWLAPGARRHIRRLMQAVAPMADRMEAELAVRLRKQGYGAEPIAGLLGVTPAAASRCRTLESFLRRAEAGGRQLAERNLAPGQVSGVLRDFEALLDRRLRGRFQPAREQLQTATTFTLYRAFYEVREREVRRLQARARQAEAHERRRIGRELHDEAGQSLVLLRLQLEMLERDAPEPLQRRLGEARAAVESIIGELRRIVAALSPAVLERLGLAAALRHMAERFRKSYPAVLRARIDALESELPVEFQEVVYRVAQEALQNVAKHSGATRVNLFLRAADKSIRLRVSDNGAGFCTETAGRQALSFGLAGMRERAELLGGTLAIRSAPGAGTAVVLTLPVSGRAAIS